MTDLEERFTHFCILSKVYVFFEHVSSPKPVVLNICETTAQ
jgi:hypothetical protein